MTLNEFLQDADEWHQERFVVVCQSSLTFPWASFIISEVAGRVGRILVRGASAMLGLRVVRAYVQYDQELVALPAPNSEKMMAIFEKSSKEQAAGFLGPWASKSQMDAKCGINGWRAMKRFAVFQAGSNS